jgi:hypothetical protein
MCYEPKLHGLFVFHVLFFCTAAGAVAKIQTVCFVNIEFRERKKLILLKELLISSK